MSPADIKIGGSDQRKEHIDERHYQPSTRRPMPHQYFLALGGISDVSTGSNSNFGSSASGAKTAFVVFRKFLSSRSGKSGLCCPPRDSPRMGAPGATPSP